MEVRYLIIARYAEFDQGGALNLIGGDTDKFVSERYPLTIPTLTVAAKLLLDAEDASRDHQFRVFVRDQNGATVAEGPEGNIPRTAVPPPLTFMGAGLLLGFANIILPQAGQYKVALDVDGVEVVGARFAATTPASLAELERASREAMQGVTSDSNPGNQ